MFLIPTAHHHFHLNLSLSTKNKSKLRDRKTHQSPLGLLKRVHTNPTQSLKSEPLSNLPGLCLCPCHRHTGLSDVGQTTPLSDRLNRVLASLAALHSHWLTAHSSPNQNSTHTCGGGAQSGAITFVCIQAEITSDWFTHIQTHTLHIHTHFDFFHLHSSLHTAFHWRNFLVLFYTLLILDLLHQYCTYQNTDGMMLLMLHFLFLLEL